jgi:hypothetical protein
MLQDDTARVCRLSRAARLVLGDLEPPYRHHRLAAGRLWTGHTRGKDKKPAPIPRAVELACKWLEYEHRPLTPAERAARWRDNWRWPLVDHVLDDRREALCEPDRGL